MATPKRRGVGSKKLDTTDLSAIVQKLIDAQGWTHLGRVFAPSGEGSQWTKDSMGRVLVEVETLPSQMDITCRLDSHAGIWTIPTVGTLVGVIVPDGKPDHMPIIAAIVGGNGSPDRVSDERVVWEPGLPIEVIADDLKLGDYQGTQPVPRGTDLQSALNGLATALQTFSTGLNSGTLSAQAATLAAYIPQFLAKTYLSGKVQVA